MAHEAENAPPIVRQPQTGEPNHGFVANAILGFMGCDRQHRSSGCGYLHAKPCREKAVEFIERALGAAYASGYERRQQSVEESTYLTKVEKLRRGFFVYAQHTEACPARRKLFKGDCDCGLDTMKAQL